MVHIQNLDLIISIVQVFEKSQGKKKEVFKNSPPDIIFFSFLIFCLGMKVKKNYPKIFGGIYTAVGSAGKMAFSKLTLKWES